MMKLKRIGMAAALMVALAVPAIMPAAAVAAPQAIEWKADFDSGLAAAKNSSLPVVVLFTGSDWCGACKLLKREVLDKPEFASAIGDKFVFIELDFPMKTKLPADQTMRNRELQQKYGITGFPTVVVLDANGNKLGASVGYPGGGVAKMVEKIDQIAG